MNDIKEQRRDFWDGVEKRLLRLAKLLNSFNVVEIVGVMFLLYIVWLFTGMYGDWIEYAKETNFKLIELGKTEHLIQFSETAYFGMCGTVIAGVIGLIKYMYHTGESMKDKFED